MGISGRHIGAFAVLAGLGTAPAFAYLDPATGSMIIQAVVGAIAGGLLYMKLFMHKVKALFSRKNSDTTSDNAEN
ncbi:hypothetical protein [Parasphingopyxis marina]|uniref:Uncharacterized protein n=1 Tax=Parasphingopyxis marina TaxID=2761622 RepID=A0A842HXJ1_9SPHN|nr:hypothetical protein [Parasphingopyxis marina]MBC2777147.1 hypothetical protein [Parasphingopyxis marina]